MKTYLNSLNIFVLALVVSLAVGRVCPAACNEDRESLLQLTDNDTFAVAIFDLDLDEEQTKIFAAAVPKGPLRKDLAKLQKIGARECAMIVSMHIQDARLVLTDPGDADLENVKEQFANRAVERKNGLITILQGGAADAVDEVASNEALDSLEAANANEIRELLSAALEVADAQRCKINAAFAAGPDQRMVLAEVLPMMIAAQEKASQMKLPQFDARNFGNSLRWLSIGLMPDDESKDVFQITASMKDEASAGALAKLVPSINDFVTAFDKRGSFTRVVKDIRFEATFDGNRVAITSGTDGFARLLRIGNRENRSTEISHRLRLFAISLHNYYAAYKHFPGVGSRTDDGKPLLSWRVLILPFVGEGDLYDQFHLDEPWDSPHNKSLIEKMPEMYLAPGSTNELAKGLTNFQLPNGNGAMFRDFTPIEFKDITDGTSNTIMVLEVDDSTASTWTKPEDWEYDPENLTRGLGGHVEDRVHVAFGDGSSHIIPADKLVRELFTSDAGDIYVGN